MADPDLGQHILSGFNAMNTIANASEMEKERRAKFIADQAMQQVQQEAQQEYIKGQQQEREFGAQMQPFKMQGQQLALKQIQMQLDLAPLETFTTIIEKFGWNPDEGYKMVDTFFPGYGEKMRKVWLESQVRKGQAAQSLNAVAPPTGPSQGEPGTPQPQPPPATQPQGQQPAQGQQPVAQGPSPAELIQQRLQAARTPQMPQRILPDLLGSASQAAGVPPVNAAQYLNPLGQMLTGTVQQQAQGIAQQAMQEAQPPAEAAVTPEMAAQVPPAAATAPPPVPSVAPQVAQALGAIAAPYSKLPTTMQEAEAMAPLLMTPKQLEEAEARAMLRRKQEAEEAKLRAVTMATRASILNQHKDDTVANTMSHFESVDQQMAGEWFGNMRDNLIRSGEVKTKDDQGRALPPETIDQAVMSHRLSSKEELQQRELALKEAKFAAYKSHLSFKEQLDEKTLSAKVKQWQVSNDIKREANAIRDTLGNARLAQSDSHFRQRLVNTVKPGGSVAAIVGRLQAHDLRLSDEIRKAEMQAKDAQNVVDTLKLGDKISANGVTVEVDEGMINTAKLQAQRAGKYVEQLRGLIATDRKEAADLTAQAAKFSVNGNVLQQQVGANGAPDKGRVQGKGAPPTAVVQRVLGQTRGDRDKTRQILRDMGYSL